MNDFAHDSLDIYVCVSHRQQIPCDEGNYHLVSNWPADVAKILGNQEPRSYLYN